MRPRGKRKVICPAINRLHLLYEIPYKKVEQIYRSQKSSIQDTKLILNFITT